jgi:lysophospholipase L1-like esterase
MKAFRQTSLLLLLFIRASAQNSIATERTATGEAQTQTQSVAQSPAKDVTAVSDSVDVSKLQADLKAAQDKLKDWPNLGRYHEANSQIQPPAAGENRVVFMGDSITDHWGRQYGKFFPGKPYLNRGISGQWTPQMLIRFRPDVIALKPKVVVILAGTNDLTGKNAPSRLEAIEDNLISMSELAKAHGIRVVLASLLPVSDYAKPQTNRRSPEQIVALNTWIEDYAARNGLIYLDYYSAMLDDKKMLKRELTYDGLHPNDAGYEVMGPLAEKAIAKALRETSKGSSQKSHNTKSSKPPAGF